MIRPLPHIADLASYALAGDDPGAISLAQNESAFPPSPQALAAGQSALRQARAYSDPNWTELCAAIHKSHPELAAKILCGAGSMELIATTIRTFVGIGDAVLGSAFGYLFVATATAQAGARYVTVPEPHMTVSVDLLREAVTAKTRVVFVCNPGNPTGTRLDNAEVVRLRNDLPADILLIVDQAYGEFDDQDPGPVFGLISRGNTIVLRTLSKAYGLAGARVGWGAFPEALGVEVHKLLNPNNISGPAQAMAAAALRDQAYMRHVVSETAELRNWVTENIRTLGLKVPDSHTNFVLIEFQTPNDATAADRHLRSEGLLLRGMAGYGLAHCLRATIADRPVMERLVLALRTHLETT